MQTNLYHYIRSEVLAQWNNNELPYFVTFFFKNLNQTKYNNEINIKQLLNIIKSLQQLKPELEKTEMSIKVITDNKILENFITIKKLSRRYL